MELRCSSKKHGVIDHGVIEIKCSSRWCGAGLGVTVLHRFDAKSGALLETKKYKDPRRDNQCLPQ